MHIPRQSRHGQLISGWLRWRAVSADVSITVACWILDLLLYTIGATLKVKKYSLSHSILTVDKRRICTAPYQPSSVTRVYMSKLLKLSSDLLSALRVSAV